MWNPARGGDVAQAETSRSNKAIIRENPVRSLAKAVLLLEALADEREATPRRLSELLHEPRTTVYRLLTGLQALDMVEAGARTGTHPLRWGPPPPRGAGGRRVAQRPGPPAPEGGGPPA